jgi:3-oxoadipate enol-lactonase
MPWIQINDAVLRYELSGNGPQVLVLLHEGGGSIESFERSAHYLNSWFRVLRYDQRGFGMSEGARSLPFGGMVQDLLDLLEELQISKGVCHLAGSGIGACIALAAAAENPHLIDGLILSGVAKGAGRTIDAVSCEELAREVESGGMRTHAGDHVLANWFPPSLRDHARDFDQYRNRYRTNHPDCFAALLRTMAAIDLAAICPKITCPTLVLGGGADHASSHDQSRELAELLPLGRYGPVDSGDLLAFRRPDVFAERVTAFLNERYVSSLGI